MNKNTLHQNIGQVGLFNSNDRICFIGDSITHTGTYIRHIQEYYMASLNIGNLTLINCGVAGDTAAAALARFDEDIMIHKPNRAVIMFGMNDGDRSLYMMKDPSESILAERKKHNEAYKKNMEELIKKLVSNGVMLCLFTPTPYDEWLQTAESPAYGYNETLKEYSDAVRTLAVQYGCQYIDFHEAMTEINIELQKVKPQYSLISADRVHPTGKGHLLMAYILLCGQKLPMETYGYTFEQLFQGENALLVENTPGKVISAEYKNKLDQKEKLEHIVRGYRFVEGYIRRNHIDISDEKAVQAYIAELLDENKDNGWWVEQLRQFMEVKDDIGEYISELRGQYSM